MSMNTDSYLPDSITTQYYNESWLHENLTSSLKDPKFEEWNRTTIGNVIFCSEKISNHDIRSKYNDLLQRYASWYLKSYQK